MMELSLEENAILQRISCKADILYMSARFIATKVASIQKKTWLYTSCPNCVYSDVREDEEPCSRCTHCSLYARRSYFVKRRK